MFAPLPFSAAKRRASTYTGTPLYPSASIYPANALPSPSTDRRALVSFAQLVVGSASTDRRAKVVWAQMQTPG